MIHSTIKLHDDEKKGFNIRPRIMSMDAYECLERNGIFKKTIKSIHLIELQSN